MTGTSPGDRSDPLDRSPSPVAARRRGLALVAGAVAIVLLVSPVGPLPVHWNPLLVGLAFVAAAALTGPRSPLWGPGLVVSAYGTATVVDRASDVSWAGGWTTVAIGLGGLLAAHLGDRGWAMSAASVAWPVVFIGLGQSINSITSGNGTITWFTAGITFAYGVAELVSSRRAPRAGTSA